jgi:hypothetical protein
VDDFSAGRLGLQRIAGSGSRAVGSVLDPCSLRSGSIGPTLEAPRASGHTTRHRLSRGGDRQLNRALHTVILYRRRHDPTTKSYIARRVAEGKSTREAVRLLKRYLARHLYRVLNQAARPAMTT